MTVIKQHLFLAILVLAAASAVGQSTLPADHAQPAQAMQTIDSPSALPAPRTASLQSGDAAPLSSAGQLLLQFRDSDIKFDLRRLMDVLRDQRHEGWVLAAYPDPKTSRPLIGAGFSLDVPERAHPQSDPLNPNTFLEPSSAQLWEAAGLEPARLQSILDKFDRDLAAWAKKRYRRRIRTHALSPDVSEAEATALLRISTIQAIHNARAYCRSFDELTGPQQMALSQLVFQMGVNLEEFSQFLTVLNGGGSGDLTGSVATIPSSTEHWQTVQHALIESQWARRYTGRATTVIAMFDPEYGSDPGIAVRRVEATLRPPVRHRRRGRSAGTLQVASYSGHGTGIHHTGIHGRRAQGRRRLS
jgi:hypothetical protein